MIVYFEPSIENLEDFVDVHVQLAIMRNTQTGIELRIMQLWYYKSLPRFVLSFCTRCIGRRHVLVTTCIIVGTFFG